jgi:DNA-binding XRE family transcriptional regulator
MFAMTPYQPIRRYWNQHNPRIDGQKVRQLRLDVGMTQKQLAEAIGVSDRTIRIWETAEGPMRDAGNIAYKLARVFGAEAPELYVRREPVSRR